MPGTETFPVQVGMCTGTCRLQSRLAPASVQVLIQCIEGQTDAICPVKTSGVPQRKNGFTIYDMQRLATVVKMYSRRSFIQFVLLFLQLLRFSPTFTRILNISFYQKYRTSDGDLPYPKKSSLFLKNGYLTA